MAILSVAAICGRHIAVSHAIGGYVCQVKAWLMTIGFSVSYGSMFVKIFYSWRIQKKNKALKPAVKVIELDAKVSIANFLSIPNTSYCKSTAVDSEF